ncbi:MBL fold metallo-hydrolase [Corallincola luteus]|uniref:MBL fold metallo-hydrolase n=2 Tax=Corallincola TaxID=1775176 RepID=A0A368NH95_9GAMM|nr:MULTISPECIES: MBL fold metallo-hydrolase [Corallincola]RCU49105.1 MBL fold metallo-hydrolase [Corallincola holothuriorum]TCI05265.1 MBL fold metallo-hydrolase [Corallincola luteus]
MALKYKTIPVTQFAQNCTLLWCTDTMQAALIDPGGDVHRLLEAVKNEHLTLSKVLLTHAHIDHIGGTATLTQTSGLPIEGPHLDDKFWIDSLPQQSQMFGFAKVDTFEPNRWLDDGDTVTVGNETLKVLHCPGHTPGHIVFYHEPSATAWVGDVLFRGSIGRTDFPKGDLPTLLASIKQKLLPLGDDIRFVPGHGPESTFGEERRTNQFVRG